MSITPRTPKVVIALCYYGPNGFLIINECPFCFCSHKHRVRSITTTIEKHKNGDVIPYHSSMVTKISDCRTPVHTYALELREKSEVPIEIRKLCRGTTAKGVPCKKLARRGECVCASHVYQLETIAAAQCERLFTPITS